MSGVAQACAQIRLLYLDPFYFPDLDFFYFILFFNLFRLSSIGHPHSCDVTVNNHV